MTDGEGEGAGGDALLTGGGLGGELQKLSGQVLEDGSGVDSSSGTDAAGEAALAEEGADATDGEDQSSLGGLVSSLLGALLGRLGGTLGGGHFVCAKASSVAKIVLLFVMRTQRIQFGGVMSTLNFHQRNLMHFMIK